VHFRLPGPRQFDDDIRPKIADYSGGWHKHHLLQEDTHESILPVLSAASLQI
jgi:hypothetical protein